MAQIENVESVPSKRWVWKDDTNTLEAVSNNHGVDKGANYSTAANKAKRNKGQLGIHFQSDVKKNDRGTPSVMSKNYGGAAAPGSRKGQTYLMAQRQGNKGSSPRPSLRAGANEHAKVTLEDVKGIALDALPEVDLLPDAFQSCYSSQQFDEYLFAILNYFESFFERLAIENKPKPMAVEPSLAEKKALASAYTRQETAQKLLAQKYCVMVLGLGLEDQHHMACGRARCSNTEKDRDMYETLYTFASYVTFITFRRQHLDLIQKELGRMFRSDTFNPASRPKEIQEVYAIDRLRDSSKKPLTPAQYRRLKPKRPAIKSIVNQCSPVLVSLLPTAKDSTPWFVDRTKAIPLSPDDMPHENERHGMHLSHKVGIIGEPMSGFNPLTLVPFGEEHEGNADENEEIRRGSLTTESAVPPLQSTGLTNDNETGEEEMV
ncbi:protein phosphatase 1 regulatory subunit 36 isoform X2 [Nematostella vectensis]|uniref:protein phosphatase 1 regulatory subunit 36 isoform X2 n=1 Tax=Nematostella vectensis TaxID=45351 RepID=UPI0020777DBB|nr:protein phosphatase 1 regulatory subunit 36 isoform X2 [Nematostella vectensis]